VASLLASGEAQVTPSGTLPKWVRRTRSAVAAVSLREENQVNPKGRQQVVGDGMVGRFDDVKEGDLYGRKDRRSFVAKTDTKNRASTGVRAPVVARKPGNAGGTNRTERIRQAEPSGATKAAQAGAKGCRKVETR